jgi:uncharacterized membrane protein YbhN (UPF0104 family)
MYLPRPIEQGVRSRGHRTLRFAMRSETPPLADKVNSTPPSQAGGPESDRPATRAEPRVDGDLRPGGFVDRPRLTLRLGRLALLVAVAVLLIARVPGLGAVRERFEHASAGWIAVSALLEVGTVVGFVLAFHAAFERRIRPALSASIGMVAQGVNVLVPAGGSSGLALMGVLMTRAGIPAAFTATRMIALFLVTSVAVDLLLVVVGGLGVATGLLPGSVSWEASLLPAAIAALVAVGIAYLPRRLPAGRGATVSGWRSVIPRTLEYVREGIQWSIQLMRSRDPLLAAGALAFVLLDVGALAAAFHAVGGGLPLGTMLLAYTLGQAGSVIPLPGTTEGGLVGVFVLYGAPLALTTAAVLLYRAAQSVIPLVLGGIGLIGLWSLPVEASPTST